MLDHPELMDRYGDISISARMTKHDMHPEDLAGTVGYLASDASGFITGQAINVDGGAFTY